MKKISVLVRKTAFVRNFEIRDGVSLTREEEWQFDAIGFGKAALTVAFSNFSMGGSVAGELDQ